MSDEIAFDLETLGEIKHALIAYKFKLCEPLTCDGRHAVYDAKVVLRDKQLACVNDLLKSLDMDFPKLSRKFLDAFS